MNFEPKIRDPAARCRRVYERKRRRIDGKKANAQLAATLLLASARRSRAYRARTQQMLTMRFVISSPCWQRVINLIPHVRRSLRWHFPAEEHESRNSCAQHQERRACVRCREYVEAISQRRIGRQAWLAFTWGINGWTGRVLLNSDRVAKHQRGNPRVSQQTRVIVRIEED